MTSNPDEYFETCPTCGTRNAYEWEDVSEEEGIVHIGATSCWEWQCGQCGTNYVERDSPINAECYTHRDPNEEETE